MPEPMTPERLARALRQLRADYRNAVECGDDETPVPTDALGAVLAEVGRLTPRQITTVEELEALPLRSAVLCRHGIVWQSWLAPRGVLWGMRLREVVDAAGLLKYRGPLLLVHTPPQDGAR